MTGLNVFIKFTFGKEITYFGVRNCVITKLDRMLILDTYGEYDVDDTYLILTTMDGKQSTFCYSSIGQFAII